MSVTRPRRAFRLGASAFAVAVLGMGAIAQLPTRASAGSEFLAQASSAGLVVTAATQEDPTGTTIEAAGPVSTASLSSAPDSEAFAADPYPGQDLLDLLNVLGGTAPVSPPPYPFAVRSGSPGTPKESISQPGLSLNADSTPTSSEGSGEMGAVSGVAPSAGTSFGSIQSDALAESPGAASAVVESIGTTSASGITVGPLFIASVASRADARLQETGDVVTSSSINVGEIAINGVQVGFDDQGLTLAGTSTPLPDAGPAASALSAAGIALSYLAPSKTATGVVAPGIAITVHQTDPNGKTVVITYTLGQASASAQPNPGTTFGAPSSLVSFGEGGSAGGQASTLPATNPPTGLAVPGASSGTNLAAAPASPAANPTLGSLSTGGSPLRSRSALIAADSNATGDLGGLLYVLLVISALATLGVGQLIRILGVRWARS